MLVSADGAGPVVGSRRLFTSIAVSGSGPNAIIGVGLWLALPAAADASALVLLPIAGKRAEQAHVSLLVGRNVAWMVVCRVLERVSSDRPTVPQPGIAEKRRSSPQGLIYRKRPQYPISRSKTSRWGSAPQRSPRTERPNTRPRVADWPAHCWIRRTRKIAFC